MIAGYLHPGKPMANMYFVLFSYSEFNVDTYEQEFTVSIVRYCFTSHFASP